MADVEVLEFRIPQGSSTLIYLPNIEGDDLEEEKVYTTLYNHFSQWGLLYNINVNRSDDGTLYSYLRFYSARAASIARKIIPKA